MAFLVRPVFLSSFWTLLSFSMTANGKNIFSADL